MAAQWTPPSPGSPCWINLFATDVPRAKTFYTEALNWTFRTTHTRSDGIIEDPNAIAHFDHGATCPAGGITKVDEVLRTEGKGGCVLYLFVEDLAATEKKILEAKGKKMTEVMPEGKIAMMQHFEDTEGNYFGIYALNK